MDREAHLARRLISHFTFEAGEIPPTMSGFRAAEGISLPEWRALAASDVLRAAEEEAMARYLDTLTVGALLKKYDTGFVKHLLDMHGEGTPAVPEGLTVEIRVVE